MCIYKQNWYKSVNNLADAIYSRDLGEILYDELKKFITMITMIQVRENKK